MKGRESNINVTSVIHIFLVFCIVWIISLAEPNDAQCVDPDIKYDYIIVGSGSAGAAAAARLSKEPDVEVLLLEAGEEPLPDSFIPLLTLRTLNSEMDWQYKTEPQSGCCEIYSEQRVPVTRGKALGGSSSINFMFYQRPTRGDLNHWASLGNEGWNYDSIFPYLQELEDYQVPFSREEAAYHSQGGPVTVSDAMFKSDIAHAFINAGHELGYHKTDFNGKHVSGFSFNHATIRNGSRCSTYVSHLIPAMRRKNLHVITNALVTKILFDDQKSVTGVLYEKNSAICTAETAREVIICGGTINSPQLLMLSGIGPKQELNKHNISIIVDLPGVGANLQDHVAVGGQLYFFNQSVTMNPAIYETENYEQRWKSSRSGPMTAPISCEVLAFFNTKHNDKSEEDWVDAEIMMCSSGVSRIALPHLKLIYSMAIPSYDNEYVHLIPIALKPKSRGSITLNSNDPHDPPKIDPNYLSHPHDTDVLVEILKIVENITETQAFQRYGASKLLGGLIPQCLWYSRGTDEHYRCIAKMMSTSAWHPTSTCKMGVRTDPLAVVDNRLRVYGVKGLRVADASIMPTVVAGHPSVTCIMIGEKVADMIKEDRVNVNLKQPIVDSNEHCYSEMCNNPFETKPISYKMESPHL